MGLPREISVNALAAWLNDASRPAPLLLDVRNHWEYELVSLEGSLLVPLGELEERVDELAGHLGRPIACLCHHGVRSLNAAVFLRALGHDATSVSGGLEAWALEVDPSAARY